MTVKLLWLSHLVPYPPKGGVLQRSHHLLRQTARYHDVALLSFIQRDHLSRRFPSVEEGLAEAREVLSGFCSHIELIPIPSDNRLGGRYRLALKSLFTRDPYAVNWLKSSEFAAALRQLLDLQRFDLVHFDTISLAPYLACLSGQSTVLDHHNIESHLMLRRAGQVGNPARKFYLLQEGLKLRNYERKVCPRFDANITCSDIDCRRLSEAAEGVRAVEIPNGVDVGYFSPQGERQLDRNLVFVGGMNWYPNRSAMLYFAREVWPRLKHHIPGVSMDVVGFDPPPYLLQLSRNDPSLRVHGFVDDVRPYLERAAVYVCPVSDGGGTKLKLLDAFAMAKATVAHPVACEGIAIRADVNVLLATNAAEIVERVGFLFENPDTRARIGTAARRLILERYTYDAIGKKLAGLYESLGTSHRCETTPA